MESMYLDEELIQDEKIDISRYYKAIIQRWWLVLIISFVIFIPWLLYTLSLPPIYEARAVVLFKSYERNDDVLRQSRTTVLTSRSFAEKVVAELGLTMQYASDENDGASRKELFKSFNSSMSAIPGDYILKIDSDFKFSFIESFEDIADRVLYEGSVDDIVDRPFSLNGFSFQLVERVLQQPQEIKFSILPFRDAVKDFRSKTNVKWNKSGNLMTVTMSDEDAFLAAEMTNRLAKAFVRESTQMKDDTGEKRKALLEERNAEANARLAESDLKLKQFKERYAVNLNSEQKTQVTQVALKQEDKDKLSAYSQTIKDLIAKARVGSVNANNPNASKIDNRYIYRQIIDSPYFNDNATMLVFRTKLKDLEKKWEEIIQTSSEQSYRAKEVENQIIATHGQIENIAQTEIKSLDSKVKRIQSKLNSLRYSMSQLPAQEQQLTELERDNKVLESQYIQSLSELRGFEGKTVGETEDIEILDPAIKPEFPASFNKKIQASVGGILGLGFGLGFVIILEVFNKSIRTADDVKKYLNLQILGAIPLIDFDDVGDFQDSEKMKQIDRQIVTHDYSPTPIGEAYRSLRTNLLFTKETGRLQSMVITSNEPSDGKSFTTANLAITFAQLKTNTLLIDADLRRGVLHNSFGLIKEPGFTNYLTRALPLETVLQETYIPNLTLISCGSLIPNPSEMLGSHQMQRFLDEARRKFDLIIFDSPPLNAATDAVVIGTQVDAVAIVIRAGKTNRDLAKQKLELFASVPANVLGTILNGTTADMAHPGYSYYHY